MTAGSKLFESRREFLAGVMSVAASAMLGGCGAKLGSAVSSSVEPHHPRFPVPSAPLPVLHATPYDIFHVPITGQSLATADQSLPILTTSQPFSNIMFADSSMQFAGVDGITLGSSDFAFVPLVATQTSNPDASNYETLGNGFADTVIAATATTMQEYPQVPAAKSLLMSCSGIPGYVYLQLCGPTNWNSSNPYTLHWVGETQVPRPTRR